MPFKIAVKAYISSEDSENPSTNGKLKTLLHRARIVMTKGTTTGNGGLNRVVHGAHVRQSPLGALGARAQVAR